MAEKKEATSAEKKEATSAGKKKSEKSSRGSKKSPAKNEPPREYNPRWSGYLYLTMCSLASFASVADVQERINDSEWAMSVAFGASTFVVALIIVIFDYSDYLTKEIFDLKKAMDGKVEGCILLFLVLWWIAGVGFMTSVGGIAYKAINIYFSSWGALLVSFHLLDNWSAEKDILSIHEMTRLSPTLKSWWFLFLSSLVEMGSAANARSFFRGTSSNGDSIFAIILGTISTLCSLFFILNHYKLATCFHIKPGGAIELIISLFLNVWWAIGLGTLTQDGGIAATIVGTSCTSTTIGEETMPGSNLYFSIWTAFFSSCSVSSGWKATRALRFAKAEPGKKMPAITSTSAVGSTTIPHGNSTEFEKADLDEDAI